MTPRKLIIALLAVAATALSFATLAQEPEGDEPEFRAGRGGGMLQRLDTNGDGLLSLEEFRIPVEARFAALDADGDGSISRAEFEAQHMARFNALDANGNGVIDPDERPMRRGMRDGKGQGKGYGKPDR